MTQTTLVLPHALPPPELAPDLIRALEMPGLAGLLSRSARMALPFDADCRHLPHEQWLAQHYAVAPGQFLLHPVHVQISRKHLLLADPRQLGLTEDDSRALFEAAQPFFEELGLQLSFVSAATWLLRTDSWQHMEWASMDAAIGENLSEYSPKGPQALALRKLQNEIQMLWFQHPVNARREAQRLAPVNSFWVWRPLTSGPQPAQNLASIDAPDWLARETRPCKDVCAGDSRIYVDSLSDPALSGDWGSWLANMQTLEKQCFAPLLAALRTGRIARVDLLASRRDAFLQFSTSRMAQYQFWRRPSLKALQQ